MVCVRVVVEVIEGLMLFLWIEEDNVGRFMVFF